MKKQYITPSVEDYSVEMPTLLAGSDMQKGTGTQPIVSESKLFTFDLEDDDEEE